MAESNIEQLLKQILGTKLGKDMRQAIHDSIKQCYDDVTSPELNIDAFETAVQNKIDSGELAAMTLADKSVTSKKLANDAVNTDNILDGAITQQKLAPGINIDIKDGGVTEEKIANYAVTAGKIEGAVFERTGCNYINPATCIDGYYIDSSGNNIENDGYRITDKIPVESHTYFNCKSIGGWEANSYVACYNSENVCLAATKISQTNDRVNGVIPEGTEYIRVGFLKVEDTYPVLILCNAKIYPDKAIISLPWFGKYIGEGIGTAEIGSDFTSLLRDIPLSALEDAGIEYYNLFSNIKDEEINGYYLPIRSKYFIYSTTGVWSNAQFKINVAYKDGTKKNIFNSFHNGTNVKETSSVDDIGNVIAVYVDTAISETILNGVMISTIEDLDEYHPYGESYFEPSEQMKQLVQGAAKEDIIKNYGSGVLLGIGDSYMQNNTALTAIAANHNLACDNRGIASSSISGNESQTVGLYPFWSRINAAVEEYTTGKTINSMVYHCEDVKLIVFMGGANDGWIDYRRGTGKTETDTDTIYGALNSCFSTLLSSFPNADIIVILQPVNYNVSSDSWDEEMAKGYGFKSLADAQKFSDYQLGQYAMHIKESIVKEMAEMYGLNIVDCCFNWYSVLNPKDREKYWRTDKLHMTSDGNDAIYNVALEGAINNLKITRN